MMMTHSIPSKILSGDLSLARKAEAEIISKLVDGTVGGVEGSGVETNSKEATDEEAEPPKKRRHVDKENINKNSSAKKGSRKRKPLTEVQV